MADLNSQGTVGITLKPAVSAGALAIEGSENGTDWFAVSSSAPGATTSALTTVGNLTVNDVLPAVIQVVATVVGAPVYGIDSLLGP
jgi:hypothetical protein